MPSIPIPQQAPIERAGWSTDFNGGVQMPNNDRTPVNPLDFANQTAALQASNSLKNAQSASAVNDMQMKQREMALSMINAAASDPDPEKAQSKLSSIIPIANKLNPSLQFDPSMDVGTARTLALGGIPTSQQPEFQLLQSRLPFLQQQLQQISNGSNAGDSSIDPRLQEARTASLIGNKELANVDMETYKSDPAILAKQKGEEKTGENLADAQKTYNVAESNLPRALERFQQLRDASDNASSGAGVSPEGEGIAPKFAQSWVGQKIEPKTAEANQIIQQAKNQGILAELGPQLQGLKGNKFLEGIANSASGLNASDPANVKKNAINGLQDQYVANMKSLAEQRRSYGDKSAPTDAQIDAMVKQYGGTPTANSQASAKFGNNRGSQQQSSNGPKPGAIEGGYIFMGGDPSKPESWKATK